jgi:excisionase family DNA binding protein
LLEQTRSLPRFRSRQVTAREWLRGLLDRLPPGQPVTVTLPREWAEALAGTAQETPTGPVGAFDLIVGDVAALVGRKPSTVRLWCEEGRFPGAYKLNGREWRIPAAALEAWVARARSGQGKPEQPIDLGSWRRKAA